ncbi:MAG TPA: glycosyl hydrolase 108 family protein, partial [Devosia sp.]|nr:glycosyl hydrolase 108 family protein [Devosia sp.]
LEGGYVDDPRDPGGATNLGITRRTLASWRKVTPWTALPKAAVAALTRAEAAEIYRGLYWTPVRGAELPAGLDLAVFDFAVNSGPPRAIRALQQLLGVAADGLFGPKTAAAIADRVAIRGAAPLIGSLCDRRLGWLRRLAAYSTFGRGWTRRVATIRTAALAMAGTTLPPPTPRKTEMNLDFLSGYKTYIVAAAMLLTGLAGVIGIDIPNFTGTAPGSLVMEALAFFFLRQGLKTNVTNS